MKTSIHASRLLLVALLVATGCDPGPPTGSVTGQVTFRGTPLNEGTISFSSTDGSQVVASGTIQPDGNYSLLFGTKTGIPLGEYSVCVHPPAVPFDPGNPGPPQPPKEFPNIPHQYRTPASSPLTGVVAEGEQELSFDLD